MLLDVKKEVKRSWSKCKNAGLAPHLAAPAHRLEIYELERRRKKWKSLLSIYKENYGAIRSLLELHTLLMLVDNNLFVLAVFANEMRQRFLNRDIFVPGISMAEEHAGTNAVDLAHRFGKAVFIKASNHYCGFLKGWHTFALPFKIEEGKNEFFTAVISRKKINSELIGLIKLFNENTMLKYKKIQQYKLKKREYGLSDKQIQILKYLARGLTTKEVARELNISISAVKYHKQKIYCRLQVNTLNQAVFMAVKHRIIPINGMEISDNYEEKNN